MSVCRLAPSPTGAQHLGNARSFLIAFWSARSQGAHILLRIEDIDSPRVKPWARQQAIDDLAWLGIDWDGEPLIQTDNSSRYEEIITQLIGENRVYPCVCSRRDIELAASAPHESSAKALQSNSKDPQPNSTDQQPDSADHASHQLVADTPVYPGTCQAWKSGDKVPVDGTYCWRFRVQGGTRSYKDLVAGQLSLDAQATLGDFPITRKGGPAAYQLAVVVDDIDSGVTEIVRGDDLLVSTFRQLQVYDVLGHAPPQFAHVPLVVGTDGRRLAKRHGDTRLSTFRDQGISPQRIVAWAAHSAGLLTEDEYQFARSQQDLDSLHSQIVERFDWKKLNRKHVVVQSNEAP